MHDDVVDVVLTDPPYSNVVEDGFRSGMAPAAECGIGYEPLDEAYCRAFVASWLPRVRHWFVLFGDHISNRWWLDALDAADLCVFAPVVWAKDGAAPRFSGDGPASQCEYIAVARTRGTWATDPPWGSLRGWYRDSTVRALHPEREEITGQKPLSLMRRLVRDYSRPGWTIADPHAGSGTTLLAARVEGRHCIASERDRDTYALAGLRLAQPFERDLFTREAS